MKILHVSTSDAAGGAARAAYRLHRGLQQLGHDSAMFVAKRRGYDSTVIAFDPPTNLSSRVIRRLRRTKIVRSMAPYQAFRSADMPAFTDDRVEYKGSVIDQLPPSNVLNLHWIARFIDYESFFPKVATYTPIIWRLPDMNPFTGGCHYAFDCKQYIEGCGYCPQLGSSKHNDLSRQIWHRKHRIFESLRAEQLHIVTPSRWLANKVMHSPLLGRFSVTYIPNSVDVTIFTPRNRYFARDVLDIPQDAPVVLFVAQFVYKRHKGFALLDQALSGLCELPNLFLLSLGQNNAKIAADVPHLHLGYLNNDNLLSLVYSAADLFVIPSLQESFGQTVLEAMSCGVPVVGFEVGGIPDMVRPGVTGALAPPGDVNALRNAIRHLLQNPAERAEMGANCRRIATEEYTLEVQARRYVNLYEKVRALHQK